VSSESIKLPTHCAQWGWDEHQYFGHSVFRDLAGRESMIGMSALSVLGRRLSKECCDVLDDIVCTSTLADPRIWPLKISRLVAAYGSTMPAVAAGLMIQEGARIGPWIAAGAAATLTELHNAIDGKERDPIAVRNAVDAYLAKHRIIPGFGTPYRDYDERIIAFRSCIQSRKRDELPNWRTMEAVIDAVRSLRQISPNIGLGMASSMLDMGITPAEVGPLATVLVQHMFVANAVESAKQSPELLREMPESHVAYIGVPARTSPNATGRVSFLHTRQSRKGKMVLGQ